MADAIMGVEVDEHGYVIGIRCGHAHSGNDRIAVDRTSGECTGCRQLWTLDDLRRAQACPEPAEKGECPGGIISAETSPGR